MYQNKAEAAGMANKVGRGSLLIRAYKPVNIVQQ